MIRGSRFFQINLVLGTGVMLSACMSGSFPWGFYCVLTGWIGLVLGSAAGTGWSDHLLGRTLEHRRCSKVQGFVLSLFTFWIPTLAAAVFGLGLVGALPDGLKPAGHASGKGRILIESFAMYFCAVGACWLVVGRELIRFRDERAGSADSQE
jgi:hypothetical protein